MSYIRFSANCIDLSNGTSLQRQIISVKQKQNRFAQLDHNDDGDSR